MFSRKNLDLLQKAIKVCLDYEEVNSHLLARILMISYNQAVPLYKELKERGIIKKERIDKSFLGWVKVGVLDKEKLRLLIYN